MLGARGIEGLPAGKQPPRTAGTQGQSPRPPDAQRKKVRLRWKRSCSCHSRTLPDFLLACWSCTLPFSLGLRHRSRAHSVLLSRCECSGLGESLSLARRARPDTRQSQRTLRRPPVGIWRERFAQKKTTGVKTVLAFHREHSSTVREPMPCLRPGCHESLAHPSSSSFFHRLRGYESQEDRDIFCALIY